MTKLFVIGDSISIGYEPHLANLLPSGWQYARKTRIEGNNTFAVDDNGGNSSLVLSYLQHRLDSSDDFNPDVILLNCGLHDIRRDIQTEDLSVSIEQYESNLRDIRQLVASRGIRLIWVTTTPVDDEQHRQHEFSFIRRNEDVLEYAAIARTIFANDAIIDLYTFTEQLTDAGISIYSDHVHFTEEVCRLQAIFLSDALAQLLVPQM